MRKIFKIFKNQRASLMVESVVALALIIISLLGIVNLLTKSFYFNFETYNRFIATNLAIEGIEILKNIIDTNIATNTLNWENFNEGIYQIDYSSFTLPASYFAYSNNVDKNFFKNNVSINFLKFDSTTLKYNYTNGRNTNFKRLVALKYLSYNSSTPDKKIIKVNSYVYWIYKGREYLINLEDNFYNWR